MDRSGLSEKMDRAWEDLIASYAGLSVRDMIQRGAMGDWSVKDIIAHITWWEKEALTHLPLIMEDEKLPRYSDRYGGIDAFNAKMLEKKRDLSLNQVLRERDQTHRHLMDFLQQVAEEYFATETRFRKRLRLDTYGHYKLHTAAIWMWREKQDC